MDQKQKQVQVHESNNDEDKWVHDSSVDHKGRVPLRASTGTWKASFFIIGTEFSERLSYYGLAANMIIYLTKVLHQDLKTAAKGVNYWAGVTTMMPLLGGFLADAYRGRFATVLASSSLYLLGLILLTMSRLIPQLKPCNGEACLEPRRIHETLFFMAIYLISIGTGGHKPALESFGADQFDDDHPVERRQKMSFFNWWSSGLCSGLLLGVTVIVYIQDHIGWAAADIILTTVMASTIAIFCLGTPFYRFRKPSGSPFTPMLQVAVAAFVKRNLPCPEPEHLYELEKSEGKQFLFHTRKFRFLDKAAIMEQDCRHSDKQINPWRLATVTKVEEMKLVLNVIPIWLTTVPFGISVAQTGTFFVKQSLTMNRTIANFTIPPASVYGLTAIGVIVFVTIYEKLLIPLLRKLTGLDRGIKILQRIGIGMIFSTLAMIVAALVEAKRLNIAAKHQHDSSGSISVFWLAPQFLILAIGDCFTLIGLQEYFYGQVPDSMRSLGIALYLSILGAANFVSSMLISVVDSITGKAGKSWFGKDLNSSRLDYFYGLVAGIIAVNLGVYAYVARKYSYKNVRKTAGSDADYCCEENGAAGMT